MATTQIVYRCLVISPSDVEDARFAVEETIQRWNAQIGVGLGARVDPVLWETHSRPQLGDHPQNILNRQLVDSCDFGIALFWSRLGTPTADHESASAEEVSRLLARGANVMVYFCDAPIPQAAMQDDQFKRLQELKKKYRDLGLHSSYVYISQLRERVLLNVTSLMAQLLTQRNAAGQPIPSTGTVTAPWPDIRVKVAPMQVVSVPPVGAEQEVLKIVVQNHSPHNFYLSSIGVTLSNGSGFLCAKDAVSGKVQREVILEPGNSHTLYTDPCELIRKKKAAEFVAAEAIDKIGRVFRTGPGELAKIMSVYEALAQRRSTHNTPEKTLSRVPDNDN